MSAARWYPVVCNSKRGGYGPRAEGIVRGLFQNRAAL